MACPLFLPDARPAPLTDLHNGECASQPGAVLGPDLLHSCNHGYARDTCERAAQSDSDAFRFLIRANHGGVIDVAWSSERNHHPVAVGTLSLTAAAPSTESEPLERQARACVDAYFRQVGE
jgi:hypothetical protein